MASTLGTAAMRRWPVSSIPKFAISRANRVQTGQGRLDPWQQFLTHFRQPESFPLAQEKLRTHLRLEHCQRVAGRGLGHMRLRCCADQFPGRTILSTSLK